MLSYPKLVMDVVSGSLWIKEVDGRFYWSISKSAKKHGAVWKEISRRLYETCLTESERLCV